MSMREEMIGEIRQFFDGETFNTRDLATVHMRLKGMSEWNRSHVTQKFYMFLRDLEKEGKVERVTVINGPHIMHWRMTE